MNQNKGVSEIGLGLQLVFHLLPGLLTTLVYAFLASFFYNRGLPSILGFFTATVLVLFPIQLGLPLLYERKRNPGIRTSDIFLFREKLPLWQVIMIAFGTIIWIFLVYFITGTTLVDPVREGLFSLVPLLLSSPLLLSI